MTTFVIRVLGDGRTTVEVTPPPSAGDVALAAASMVALAGRYGAVEQVETLLDGEHSVRETSDVSH